MAGPFSTTVNWDQLNTLTNKKLIPPVADQIFRSNLTLETVKRTGMGVDGGAYIQRPLLYQEGPGGPYSGRQTLDTTEAEIVTGMIVDWKFYYASAAMLRQDILKNSGSSGQDHGQSVGPGVAI